MDSNETLETMLKYLKSVRKEVAGIKKSLVAEEKMSYTNQEIMMMFGISTGTLKKWRDEGLLGFSRVDNTYMYSKQDVADFLKATHFDAFASDKKYLAALHDSINP